MSAEFKTNVLVVDDDKEIVGAIAALLEREGYNIYKVTNIMKIAYSFNKN